LAVRVHISPEAERLLAQLQDELNGINAALWAPKLAECTKLLLADKLTLAALCFGALIVELEIYPSIAKLAGRLYHVLFGNKGGNMALSTITSPPVCSTGRSQHKGICCAALTQLGAAQAAIGFQYTSCASGRTVCMKCGIGSSTSPKHPGRPIFIPRRVQCGPSGCPALGSQVV